MQTQKLFTPKTDLQNQLQGALLQIQKSDEKLIYYEQENSRLMEIIRKIKRQAFGPRKERWESEEQLVFNEAEALAKNPKPEDLADEESEVEVSGFKRKRGVRKPLPEDLPREILVIELPAHEQFGADGTPLKPIGKEISEKFVYEPAVMKVVEHHRIKYGADSGDYEKTAPALPSIIPKGIATPSLLAGIVTNKYADGLPLYRQEEMFERIGVSLPRCTQARWIIQVAEACIPIRNVLQDWLYNEIYVSCDETRIQVLKEKSRDPESQSWMWVRCTPGSEKKIILFDYDTRRSGEVAKRLFADYQGTLQVDGYSAYNILEKQEGIIRIGCNMHGRRGFYDAWDGAKQGKPLAEVALKFYKLLYAIEEKAKGLSADARYELRILEARPIWDKFKLWADENHAKVPPKSKIGQAFHYFLGEYKYLIGYLQNGIFEMDNGFAERAVKYFAIGRKNWLFANSEAGAEASSILYSLVVTAKLNGVNPHMALGKIFAEIPLAKTIEDYERLAAHLVTRPAPS